MHLAHLRLTNFKNYASADFAFAEGVNLIVGLNGTGKTNLLDAIYCLCACKSYFNYTDGQNVRHEAVFFRVEGDFVRQQQAENVVFTYTAKKKDFLRNRSAYEKLSEHIGLLPVVMIAPDDIALVKEGSELRRKLLDTALSQSNPPYLAALIRYNRLLAHRNALLKQFAERQQFDATLLDTYTTQLVPLGNYIHACRQQFCQAIEPLLQHYYGSLCKHLEVVSSRYQSSLHHTEMGLLLDKNLHHDRQQQRTTDGIHRDDWVFGIGGYALKKYGSQGQQKSFLIALKLALYELLATEVQLKPILLLDDIFDKLDPQRIAQLLQITAGNTAVFGQIFISDTQPDRIQQSCATLGIATKVWAMLDYV